MELQKRKNTRLKGFDYSSNGAYFITICTQDRQHLFGASIWQRSYHDHIVKNEDEYFRIWQYIDENPARWIDDEYYCEKG